MKSKNKALFLDRDGIINEVLFRDGKLSVPYTLSEFKILPKVKEAIKRFKGGGFLCVVVTNQPDIGRGEYSEEELKNIHGHLQSVLEVDAIYHCPHSLDNECECKKPKPGLLFRAAQELDIDLSASYIVGDRWRDIEAGEAAGCKTIHIPTEATITDAWRNKQINADFFATNLFEVAELLVK